MDELEAGKLVLWTCLNSRMMDSEDWQGTRVIFRILARENGGSALEFGVGDGARPQVVGFGQGFQSMSGPTKEIERLVLGGKLRHGGNAVLRWMASNVAVRMDPAGNLKIDRQRSTEKVDGMVALAMAIGAATRNLEETAESSIYNDAAARPNGLVTLG